MSDPEAAAGLALLGFSAAGLVAVQLHGRSRWPRIAAAGFVTATLALGLGAARLEAIDSGAFRGATGRAASATGFVVSVPRRSHGEVRVEVSTPEGKLLLAAHEPVPELAVGAEVRASGVLAPPDPYLLALLRRHGIAAALRTEAIEPTGARRGGFAGLLDAIRARAEAALGDGMREPQAALARGFVLGEDDRIDPQTVDEFKGSGLQHHLAVSGENILLLAVLAMPLLALAGLGLRGRLLCVLILIAIYVPVAGGGASIQRAGVMGAAGVVALLEGRPRSRVYAVLLAVFATLLGNPRAAGDVGWQLSFAAVIGIFLWARRIARLLPGGEGGGWRRALAEGVAMTIAATVATAPLMAHDFERISLTTLPANVLALPAIAPAMWLGMLVGGAGQLPFVPVAPLNAVNQLVLAYIEQVAHWFGSPGWATAPVRLAGVVAVVAAYAAVVSAMWLGLRAAERRGRTRPRWRPGRAAALAGVAVLLALAGSWARHGAPASSQSNALRVSILDVGQGDAILLRPPGSDPVLVDGGPPGDGITDLLAAHGVERLAEAIVTHPQSDHEAGVIDVLGSEPVAEVGYGEPDAALAGAAAAAGARTLPLAEGDQLSFGDLQLTVLWPPREPLAGDSSASRPGSPGVSSGGVDRTGPTDPNARALVIRADWRHFSILLTADAEQELAPVQTGAVDVLKVAHHGSADAGLDHLLETSVPDLAVISVGEGNSYGHPTPETLADLAEHRVPLLRTDEDGTIEISADDRGWRVDSGG